MDLMQRATTQGLRWQLRTWNKTNPTPLTNANYLPDTEYMVHAQVPRTETDSRHIADRSCAAPDQGGQGRAWALAQAWGQSKGHKVISGHQSTTTTARQPAGFFTHKSCSRTSPPTSSPAHCQTLLGWKKRCSKCRLSPPLASKTSQSDGFHHAQTAACLSSRSTAS